MVPPRVIRARGVAEEPRALTGFSMKEGRRMPNTKKARPMRQPWSRGLAAIFLRSSHGPVRSLPAYISSTITAATLNTVTISARMMPAAPDFSPPNTNTVMGMP